MLADVNLDTETYEDIMEEAVGRIAGYNPEWTDYNAHDPGITMLEMFSWLKEVQHYTMNQVGEEHHVKYLKLLGARRKGRKSAKATLNVRVRENLYLPKGTRFHGGGVPFETEEDAVLLEGDVACCIVKEEYGNIVYQKEQLNAFTRYGFYPFGEELTYDDRVYVGFVKPWVAGVAQTISIRVYEGYPVKRNPISVRTKRWEPLNRLAFEYYAREGEWKPLTLIRDETHGFLVSGNLTLRADEEMGECKELEVTGYYIRIRLLENYYEIPPKWTQICMNSLAVSQRESLAQSYLVQAAEFKEEGEWLLVSVSSHLARTGVETLYFVFEGYHYPILHYVKKEDKQGRMEYGIERKRYGDVHPDAILVVCYDKELANHNWRMKAYGFPDQSYDLEDKDLLGSALRVLVMERRGFYREWEQVYDLDHSVKTDRHFTFDENEGVLSFGDGIRGRVADGEVRIISYVRSLGRRGNLKAGGIQALSEPLSQVEGVTNLRDAVSGRDAETTKDCFARLKREDEEVERAVTSEDYEKLVYQTPGLMIENCKVTPSGEAAENTVTIAVKPFSLETNAKVNDRYAANIKNHLEDKRMLGTRIEVLSPEYVDIYLMAEVQVKAHYQNAKSVVEAALWDYFKRERSEFGKAVSYHRIYGELDRLEAVVQVASLTMDARGVGVSRNENGDVLPPPNGLIRLAGVQCVCRGVLER